MVIRIKKKRKEEGRNPQLRYLLLGLRGPMRWGGSFDLRGFPLLQPLAKLCKRPMRELRKPKNSPYLGGQGGRMEEVRKLQGPCRTEGEVPKLNTWKAKKKLGVVASAETTLSTEGLR